MTGSLGERPYEIELKLAATEAQLPQVRRHAQVRAAAHRRAVTGWLDARYFDTPARSLQAAGFAVRLREAAGRWTQAVKTRGTSTDGLHQRDEWEHDAGHGTLDLDRVPHAATRAALQAAVAGQPLIAVFRTHFRRQALLLDLPDGSLVELALDHGWILAGDPAAPAREALCEIELELVRGDTAALLALGAALQADLGLQPEPRSKAQRGHALAVRVSSLHATLGDQP